MIEADGLSTRVGGFALHDVTFTVPAGGYGVVIGPAGSGKTTLLETIAGITPQRGGTLRLGGRDVRGLPPERRDVASSRPVVAGLAQQTLAERAASAERPEPDRPPPPPPSEAVRRRLEALGYLTGGTER